MSSPVFTLPNVLTLARIAGVPLLVASLYLDQPAAAYASTAVFAAASVTDYFDGYLARKLNQPSELGRVLDPIADKLLVAAALVMLAAVGGAAPIAVTAILCRELLVSGLREALAGRVVLAVTMLAKWKTASQMSALLLLLIAPAVASSAFGAAAEAALWLAVALSWLTAADYLRSAWRVVAGAAPRD